MTGMPLSFTEVFARDQSEDEEGIASYTTVSLLSDEIAPLKSAGEVTYIRLAQATILSDVKEIEGQLVDAFSQITSYAERAKGFAS